MQVIIVPIRYKNLNLLERQNFDVYIILVFVLYIISSRSVLNHTPAIIMKGRHLTLPFCHVDDWVCGSLTRNERAIAVRIRASKFKTEEIYSILKQDPPNTGVAIQDPVPRVLEDMHMTTASNYELTQNPKARRSASTRNEMTRGRHLSLTLRNSQ